MLRLAGRRRGVADGSMTDRAGVVDLEGLKVNVSVSVV